MATTGNQKPVNSSSAATGEKPSFLLFGGLALIGLLKDTLDLIGIGSLPVLGTGITLCFSFFSFMLLLLFDRSGGRGNKRLAQGMVVTFGTLIEGIGFVINFLPLQTLTAVFLYIISYRAWKSAQRSATTSTNSQQRKAQTQQARMARAIALREERMQRAAMAADTTSTESIGMTQERTARAPRMAEFEPPKNGAASAAVAPVVAGIAASVAPALAVAASQAKNQAAGVGLQPASPARSTGGASNTPSQRSNTPASMALPIVRSEHGYGVDIGNGEIFGEYRTADEARQAMPEAIRSRDGRQAYLKNLRTEGAPKSSSTVSTGAAAVVTGVASSIGSPVRQRAATENVLPNRPTMQSSPSAAPAQRPARLETFDARKELAGLKAIPKAERREKLAEIKQNLSRQTEGLAQVQTNIFTVIRNNPDASYDDLRGAMLQQGATYGMNDRQKEVGSDVLKKYVTKHEEIRGLRSQYPDNRELFKALFGRPPKGDVEVVDGPMTFYFKCKDVNDFALIRSQSFIEGREPTAGEVSEAARYGGLAGVTTLVPAVNGAVMAENSSHEVFQKSPAQSDTVRTHEEQHVMNHLFAEQFDEARDVISRFHEAQTRGEKEVAVEDYLRYFQEKAEEESRDEILAYFKDGRSLDEILTTLTLKKDEGGGYDFLVDDRASAEYNVALLFGEDFQAFARSKAGKMYDTEYREHLKTALQSVERLTKAGYDRDKAIALLVHEPLSRWDKVTGRLLTESGGINQVAASPVQVASKNAESTARESSALPIVKSEFGYSVDIGGGELFGEYATPEEAQLAVPEAVRSRDARQAYLRKSPPSRPSEPSRIASAPLQSARPVQTVAAQHSVPLSKTPATPTAAATKASVRTGFTKLKDLSTDASARIREAGSRLSQVVRPKMNASTATGVSKQMAEIAVPLPSAAVLNKEQLFESRLASRMRNPNQPLDDSKMIEQLFQKTPEYSALGQRSKQISAVTTQIAEIDSALRSYLSVKNSQSGMQGSGDYMATGNQQVRVDAATRLHELSKKYESTFPYLKRYTDWKNINWTNVARTMDLHQDAVGQYRQEKEKFDQEVSAARFKFNQGIVNDYQAWLNQRKGQKRAA